jgi:predicted RNase H-like HicB family nuclease
MSKTIALDELVVPITVDYLEEDRVYKVSVPALQGCHAWGETLDEAMQAIPGNVRAMLQARRAKGASIPPLFRRASGRTSLVLRMAPA